MKPNEAKLVHLDWAVKSRHSNQVCALRLLQLFGQYEDAWKTKKFARAAQDLVAVSFSLWRAAFLADKTGKRENVFLHGKIFLERIIEDNAISFPQDKSSREWTFNYYTRNARSSLTILNKYWPEEAPIYEGKARKATDRWDYCQSLLEETVSGFERLLEARKLEAEKAKRAERVREARKTRRTKVRRMTLSERNKK